MKRTERLTRIYPQVLGNLPTFVYEGLHRRCHRHEPLLADAGRNFAYGTPLFSGEIS